MPHSCTTCPPNRGKAKLPFGIRWWLAVAALFLTVSLLPAQEQRVVLFHNGTAATPGTIRWPLLTHLIWFDNSAISNSVFTPPTGSQLTSLLQIRDTGHQNGKKVMYGLADQMPAWTNMIGNTALRSAFVQGVSQFVLTNNFDGVDFDIEYPTTAQQQAGVETLMTDMRATLGRQPLLTMDPIYYNPYISSATINNQLDWVNVQDYYHATNSPTQLAFAKSTLQTYLNAGVWPAKIVLGGSFGVKSPSDPYDVSYSSIVPFISPYNTAQDIATNSGNGKIYYLNGNQDTMRAKVDLAATNANGMMFWAGTWCDTTNSATSLNIAVNNESTNKIAVMDGFEYPTNGWLDSIYTNRNSCTLAVTNERVGGDTALLVAAVCSGSQYSGGNFKSPLLANGWSFPGGSLLRLDLRTVTRVTNATFVLTLYDGAGGKADYYDYNVLQTANGWVRYLIKTNNFVAVTAGFNWNDIRQHRFLSQLSAAGAASTNRFLLDSFVLFNPAASRPTRTDAGFSPAITQQPTNLTVFQGSSATFSVIATGTGLLGYQWQKTGANILAATNASYTIASAAPNDATNYSVRVVNAFGLTNSVTATLAVAPPLLLTMSPAATNVLYGISSLTLTANATGAAPLAYRWYDNHANLIAGAVNATLALTAPAVAASGNYTVVVTNPAAVATNFCAVTVSPAPLTVTASNANKYFGQTLAFAGTEFSSSGLLNGDAATNVTLTSSGAGSAAPVQNHAIIATSAQGVGLANYNISYISGVLAVLQPPVPVPTNAVYAGGVGFNLSGPGVAGQPYVLLGTPNLVPPVVWMPLVTNVTGSGGVFQLIDPQATNNASYFYLIRTP